MPVTGGHRLKAAIRQGLNAPRGPRAVQVGFFRTARYPDGTAVAMVAMSNEFGLAPGVPERPFFRQAIRLSREDVSETIRDGINTKTGVVTERLAGLVGALVQGAIQQRITDLREPPNAPTTIARKGSSNPLIDTGTMRTAVTWATVR